jgi:hypothetical protein
VLVSGLLIGVITVALATAAESFGILLLGILAWSVLAVVILVRWAFGPSVLVVEGHRGTKALGRSNRLARGSFWRIVGVYLLASILAGIIAAVVSIIPAAIAEGLGSGGWFVVGAGNAAASIVTTPFTTMVIVLLYFDLRIRKEGFDLQVMAQEIRSAP